MARRARRCSARTRAASAPLPKSGRFTRSPGAVNSTCSIRSRMCGLVGGLGGAAASRRSGRGRRGSSSPHVPITRVCTTTGTSGVPVGAQMALRLSISTTGWPLDEHAHRADDPLRGDARHRRPPAVNGQPATAYGAAIVADRLAAHQHARIRRGRHRLAAVRAEHGRADDEGWARASVVLLPLDLDDRQRAAC